MAIRIGYLVPTRESVMEGRHEAAPLLALAERAEVLGYDSVWVGDSLLARPRHEPLTLLAAAAARTRRVALGTAVLLPALRNPVVLAHQVATLDRIAEGRLILGVGIGSDVPNIRAEFAAAGVPFEKRAARMLEGLRLCRALWRGEPVDWEGRWTVREAVLGPTPHRPGGPPIWLAGAVPATIGRVGRHFDGWFPNGPSPADYAATWAQMQAVAREAGRAPEALTGAAYLTLAVDRDAARAEARLDAFLARYYGQRSDAMRKKQACYAGPPAGARDWLQGFVAAGASHLVLRFAGEQERQMELLAGIGAALGR
ncbi:LLM class flavin-dependent oxidoreductase [Caldovatus aquaticus]|uniref:LLM class flavin-dependent oxidoreductase n=1 Tax=Caldovatus aquaticus TaxID=2865671 RepID=A0ABS7F018_9PROT|nr:LLM class flavin-dependent oxidoreductase [Caldovatus aquaticus]MBW8268962.1 LLM class flavin-dependent oxidoreductase [Caldovatus aquaticus]